MTEKIGLQAVLELSSFSAAVASYNQAISGMSSNTASTASSINSSFAGLGSIILDIGAKAAQIAVGGIALLGSALVAIGVQGTTAFIQLEQGFANLEAISGDTKAQLEPLKGLISDLALDPNLKVTANEATEAMFALTKQGLSVEQIMGGAGRATVELSNATGAQFTPAATIAAGVMKAWSIEASNLSTVADGMTGVLTNSKFTVDDYNLAFAQSGTIFSNLGGSYADFNTVIAGTASAFSGGSDAGTSFKNLILTMSAPTKEAKSAMDQYGISIFNADGTMKNWSEVAGQLNKVLYGTVEVTSTVGGATREQAAAAEKASSSIGDLTRDIGLQEAKLQLLNDKYQEGLKFYDAGEPKMRAQALAIEGLTNNIQDQKEQLGDYQQAILAVDGAQERTITSTKNLTEAERAKLAETIAGRDSSRLLLELGKLTSDQYDELSGKINKNGQAMNAASVRMDTTSGALDILRGIVEAIQLQIGEKFTPMVKAAAKAMSLWASENSGTIIAFFGTVADGMQKVIDGVIKVSGAFQRFGIRGAAVSILGQLGLDQSQISKAMGVVDQVIGAINRIKGAFDEFGIGGAAFSILGMLGMSPETITLIDTNLTGIVGSITTFVDNVMLAFSRFGASGAAFSILGQLGVSSDTLITLQTTLGEIVSSVTGFVTQIQEAFAGGAEGGGIAGGFAAVFESLKASLAETLPTIAGELLANIPIVLTQVATGISDFLAGPAIPIMLTGLSEWGTAFWGWATTAIEGVGTALAGILLAISAWVASPEAQTQLNDIGKSLGGYLVTGVGLMLEQQDQWGTILLKVVGGLLAAVAVITADLVFVGGQLVAGIISGILESLGVDLQPATLTELKTILDNIASDGAIIAEFVGSEIVKGLQIGMENAWTAFKSAIKTLIPTITPLFAGIVTAILPYFEDTFKKASDLFSGEKWLQLGTDAIAGLLEGMKEKAGEVLEFIKSLAADSLTGLGQFWGAESPATAFIPLGASVPQGLAVGINNASGLATQAIQGMGRDLLTSTASSLDFIDDLDMGGLARGFGTGGGQWRNFRNILKNEIMGGMGALADGTADVMDSVYKVAARFNFPPAMAAEFAEANGLVEHLTGNFAEFKKQMNIENLGNLLGMGGSFSGVAGTLADMLQAQMGSADEANKTVEAYQKLTAAGETQANQLTLLQQELAKLTTSEGVNQIAVDKKRLAIEKATESFGFGERQLEIYRQELAILMQDEAGNALQIEKKTLQIDRQVEAIDAQSKQLVTLQQELEKLTSTSELDTAAIEKKRLAIEKLTQEMAKNQQAVIDSREAFEALATGSAADQIAFLQSFLESGADSIRLIGEELEGVFAGQGATSDVYWTRVAAQEELTRLLEEQRRQEELITQQKEAQGKLDKLKAQLDLINLGRQLGGDIFAGITFGLDASIEDLLAATNAVTMAMVDQINHDLQIHSPSGVMIKTFEQVMAGAALGVRRGESMLSDAMRSIPILNGSMPQFSQAAGISNSSTYNYNFPMTVNTAATAQGVVRQYDVRRSLANV